MKIYKFILLTITSLVVFSISYPVVVGAQAITTDDIHSILTNKVFYDPNASCGSSESTTTTGSVDLDKLGDANKGYNGDKIWNSSQLKLIESNQPFYEKAAEKEGIPWQLIPPVHLRESGLGRSNPSNGQGIYQDPTASAGKYPTGKVSDAEFQKQTDWVANVLKAKAKDNPNGLQSLKGSPEADAVKETYFGYNGRADVYVQQAKKLGFKLGSDGSPYVMNQADKLRDPAKNKTTWGQVKVDYGPIEYPANAGWGAYVMYAALAGVEGGASGAGGDCQSGEETLSGTCAEKIIQIAEQEFKKYGGHAIEGSSTQKKYSDGVVEPWCADFVSWVLKEAGSPFKPSRIPSVDGVKAYFQSGKGEYNAKGNYKPRPGDIVIYDQGGSTYASHVNIVIEVKGNNMTTIGGNESDGIMKHTWPTNMSDITGFGTVKCSN